MYAIFLLLLITKLVAALRRPVVSEWSTEPLHWTSPTNLTHIELDGVNAELVFPLSYSLILRIYDGLDCKPIDSDLNRGLWWAEVRRHVPNEYALVVAQMDALHLPPQMTRKSLGLDSESLCSTIAYLPFGSDGRQLINIAPPDREGMPAFVKWISSALRVHTVVFNPLRQTLTLYWVDDTLNEHMISDIPENGQVPQNTFVGHVYVARSKANGKAIDWWAMDGNSAVRIENKAKVLETRCQAPISAAGEKLGSAGRLQHDTGSHCMTSNEAMFQYIYDSSMGKRHALNTVQPTVVHNYSETGYALLQLPDETFAWLKSWYEANADKEIVESNAGAVGTQHEAPWHVRHITPQLKQRLIDELRPILAEWSKFPADSLEMTSIYGIRRYTRGSRLRMHVDTVMSHVVSAIINVAQGGINTDWPLEIKSHDGKYHYVNMKPGDMLLYESAKCLHGRPQELDGDFYSNIFLHFKPTNEGSWEYHWY